MCGSRGVVVTIRGAVNHAEKGDTDENLKNYINLKINFKVSLLTDEKGKSCILKNFETSKE